MQSILWRIFINLGLIVLALGLLFGGVAILNTQIPFWSIVYGILAISLGLVLCVISFNEITKNRSSKVTEYHQIPCRVCQKNTLVPLLITSTVCPECQYKVAIRVQTALLVFFLAIAIPVTYHLVKTQQKLYPVAKTPETEICSNKYFTPTSCSCGKWANEIQCNKGEFGRLCGNQKYCCYPEKSSWNCIYKKESK